MQFLQSNTMPTVLIVDDEMLIRWALAETLSGVGFGIIEAGTEATALDSLRSQGDDIAVALLDLRLAGANDFQLLRHIKRLAPQCQVIVMTAEGSPGALAAAVAAGAFSALTKPFDMHVMTRFVCEAAAAPPAERPSQCETVLPSRGVTRPG